jgi:hypothetical protein
MVDRHRQLGFLQLVIRIIAALLGLGLKEDGRGHGWAQAGGEEGRGRKMAAWRRRDRREERVIAGKASPVPPAAVELLHERDEGPKIEMQYRLFSRLIRM